MCFYGHTQTLPSIPSSPHLLFFPLPFPPLLPLTLPFSYFSYPPLLIYLLPSPSYMHVIVERFRDYNTRILWYIRLTLLDVPNLTFYYSFSWYYNYVILIKKFFKTKSTKLENYKPPHISLFMYLSFCPGLFNNLKFWSWACPQTQ